jgi:biotin carboxyl carrier protein
MASETIEIPIAGKVTEVNVTAGGTVKEGDVLCILESMKMENPVLAPVSGTVKEIHASPEQFMNSGDVLAIIEY